MNLRTNLTSCAFTLLELLVVIAIVATLAGVLLPALARGKQKAKQVSELNAARQLLFAWQINADENEDSVLPGYSSQAEAQDDLGNSLGSPIRDRYPWRLASQLAENFRSIYVNESRRFLDEAENMSHADYVYRASLYPSLGYNSVFLGGDEQKFNPALAEASYGAGWLTTKTSQIRRPAELLAFASARARPAGRDEPGYYVVHPPYLTKRQWSPAFQLSEAARKVGLCASPLGRRAVAAMTDGHAEVLFDADLQDMRHWANTADRPDWTLTHLSAP
jgi:prepilin-type N-terminal cleavage/methylation domain-containing protein